MSYVCKFLLATIGLLLLVVCLLSAA